MAVSNIPFMMPQEPRPLPSLESDEESFVVLGQSINDCSTETYADPIDVSVVAEAKRLISSELAALEEMKNKDENDEKKVSSDETDEVSQDVSNQKMDSSTVLPAMPVIEKCFESTNGYSLASFSADMSSEEVQSKISQIIDENIHLKDTVLQNNMSLKSQYERIVAWQEDVQKVHQAHKEKLLDAKIFIENLKKEKENLKRDLTKAGEVNNNLAKEITELNKSLKDKETITTEVLVQRSDDNIKEFQLDVANKKIKDLEADIEKLTIENKKLLEESAKSQVTNEDSKKLKDLEMQLSKLAIENTLKDQECQKVKVFETELQTLRSERDLANKNLNEYSKKIKELEIQLENEIANEKVKNVEKENEKFAKLHSKCQNLQEELDYATTKIEELKNELFTKSQRENALIMATNSLKMQLENDRSSEEIKNLRTQLAETQSNLTQVECSRGQAYNQVSQLSQELARLKKHLAELQAQSHDPDQSPSRTDADRTNDEIYALKTQLDVYKTDFQEERHAREVLKEEKDRIEADLQTLQRRNQQLQEEIEVLRGEQDYVVYTNRDTPRVREQNASAPPSQTSYQCPKCSFNFRNLADLEAHVYRCIELDDRLP